MLDWRKRFQARTSRVKYVDIHPTQPWALAGLYAGSLTVYEYTTQQVIQKIEVGSAPIRCAKFVPSMNWIACGTDEGLICIYNAVTQEKLHVLEAHSDYVRCLALHPTLPLLLSCADDMDIHCWNLNTLNKMATFLGHQDYVMKVAWNPRDANSFASCSLDGTIKLWSLPSNISATLESNHRTTDIINVTNPNYTLLGHTKGVNSVEFCEALDKPFIISASDDHTIRVWDCQSRQCLQTLSGHQANVSHAVFHPYLAVVLSASEDGAVRIWNASTYRCTQEEQIGMGRVWYVGLKHDSNEIAIAADEGICLVSLGSDRPLVTMHSSGGRVVLVKGSADFHSINFKQVDAAMLLDGKKVSVQPKEIGSSDLFPHRIEFSPNGRYLGVQGEEQFSILTSQALRVKSYGQADYFAWLADGSYAVAQTGEFSSSVEIKDDSGSIASFTPGHASITGLFGNGPLLAVAHGGHAEDATNNGTTATETVPASRYGYRHSISFYHPQGSRLIVELPVAAVEVCWHKNRCTVATETGILLFDYHADLMQDIIERNEPETDEGLPYVFTLLAEWNQANIISALMVGSDAVFYTTRLGKLCLLSHGLRTEYSNVQGDQYLLGYLETHQRLLTADRDGKITSHFVDSNFLKLIDVSKCSTWEISLTSEAGGAETEQQLEETLEQLLQDTNEKCRPLALKLLSRQGYDELALKYATDPTTKYDMALKLKKLPIVVQMLQEDPVLSDKPERRWNAVGQVALQCGEIDIAIQAYRAAQNLPSLFMIALSLSDQDLLQEVAHESARNAEQNNEKTRSLANLAYLGYYLLRDHNNCIRLLLDNQQEAEAALYARSFAPSQLESVVQRWEAKNAIKVERWPKLQVACDAAKIMDRVFNTFKPEHVRDYEDLEGFDFAEEFENLGPEEFAAGIGPNKED
ncbi:coatomer protein [Gregarina niphandrodes]|uniref:Coatomer subunit beta' n=1 Tax=Gregarina niphandrodes TaxID=110365 RepID=A0A023B077_GRENI|nr:coatomer protein [Gregarina niphandrodes]EZG44378.1 coatomer protein [Gregarina niphandrodes]|eukprot:XP_011132693.1 coatomer protein [Gregarina niphandrodes]